MADVPMVAPAAPRITNGTSPIMVMPFWDARNPAVGNTASVGIGGMMVSNKAAKNTPS